MGKKFKTKNTRASVALYLLCRQKHPLMDDTTALLRSKLGIEVYVVEDNESLVKDAECFEAGMINSCTRTLFKRVVSWDRALYLATHVHTGHSFAWFIEDDVLIPCLTAFRKIIDKYSGGNHHCVCNGNAINTDGSTGWHWSEAKLAGHPLPWYGSMVCVAGLSRLMLDAIKDYALINKKLMFIEVFFPTLCAHRFPKTGTTAAPEFQTVVYRRNWEDSDFDARPDNLFHPVKDYQKVAIRLLSRA